MCFMSRLPRIMARLNDGEAPGTPFILGIDNQRQHDTQLKQVMSVFLRSDVEKLVAIPSYEFAQVRLAKAGDGQLDAVRELITAVPLEICKWYFGVNVDIDLDRQKFADAAMDVSGHLFGKPPVDPIDEVDRAADYVRWVVDQSIDKALSAQTRADNILTRLVEMKFDRKTIRAFLMGMIVGFVPTNTMAGGHILEMLLSRREYMERSQAAAKAGDDDLLRHCLFETLRFMPINPGPFRLCSRDYEIAAGTPRAKVVRRDRTVFVMDMSAMADPEQVDNPKIFDPSRPASNYLNFGFGMHWCAGAFIAQAQITQTFKPLLRARKVERVDGSRGELQRRAGFPDHLFVSFKEV